MRLGDFANLKTEILWGNVNLSDKEENELIYLIDNQPTIDPETLPIVKELRAEIERQNRLIDDLVKNVKKVCNQRDAAMNDLRVCAIESCTECVYCSRGEKDTLCWNCTNGLNWEWRGLKDENNS